MAEIHFIDQTLRDGQQSLWGMKMRAGHILPIAEEVARAGYACVELTGSTIHTVLVREFSEDPYEGLDLITSAMAHPRLRGGIRPDTAGFQLQPYSVIDLSAHVMMKHGINSFWIFDCLFNLPRMERLANVIGRAGCEVIPTISFAQSEVHTDEFFAGVVDAMVQWDHVDAIMLADESGVLTPERVDSLLPALLEAAAGVPLELHFHNTTGLAPYNYLKGIDLGITRIHTCSRPLANGPSLPSTEVMVENVTELGHTTSVDQKALERIASHIEFVGRMEGYELGVPNEYRVSTSVRQLPGGMMGTLKSQLAVHRMEHLLDDLLSEVARVRAEFGYPVMATPFSQIIGTQALLNITAGRRYEVVSDEAVLYAYGHYGDPPVPMDSTTRADILATERGGDLADWSLAQPSLEELREQYGAGLSDEELLLRILAPEAAVDAMIAAGPVKRDFPTAVEPPLLAALKQAAATAGSRRVDLRLGDLEIALRR